MPNASVRDEAHVDDVREETLLAAPVFALNAPFFFDAPMTRVTKDNRDLHAPRVFGFRYAQELRRVSIPRGRYDPQTQTFIPDLTPKIVDELTFSHMTQVESGPHEDDGQLDEVADIANGE